MNKLILWIKKQYIKFVMKQCKHICMLCKYRNDCLPYFYDEYKNKK